MGTMMHKLIKRKAIKFLLAGAAMLELSEKGMLK